jgi:hypothetical protein
VNGDIHGQVAKAQPLQGYNSMLAIDNPCSGCGVSFIPNGVNSANCIEVEVVGKKRK